MRKNGDKVKDKATPPPSRKKVRDYVRWWFANSTHCNEPFSPSSRPKTIHNIQRLWLN